MKFISQQGSQEQSCLKHGLRCWPVRPVHSPHTAAVVSIQLPGFSEACSSQYRTSAKPPLATHLIRHCNKLCIGFLQ